MKRAPRLATGTAALLLAGWTSAGCDAGAPPGPLLEAQLWKRAAPSIALASGDHLAAGDELFLTVLARRTVHLYVVSEDASGRRQLLYPCRRDGITPPLAAGRPHRLPRPLLGRETFWPVREVTPHERLLVLATRRPAAALEDALHAPEGAPPCALALAGEAWRWLDGLSVAAVPVRRQARTGEVAGSWVKPGVAGEEVWTLAVDLAGAPDHG